MTPVLDVQSGTPVWPPWPHAKDEASDLSPGGSDVSHVWESGPDFGDEFLDADFASGDCVERRFGSPVEVPEGEPAGLFQKIQTALVCGVDDVGGSPW